MNLLLDTHILIWWMEEHRALSSEIKEIIADPANAKYYSIISLWEIAIKRSLGKLELSANFQAALDDQPFDLLPLEREHVDTVATLLYHLHRDPFDRMLVAQAKCEGLTFISKDRHLERYGIKVIPV